ncbi:hypothetical protein MFRU_021g01140 [Monilinia fructicola]|uniref:Uncharacterized protein n=1 Tax=Monilinia fructicola TaxID=38448 RepID=A0A5M9K6A5_MONFR|nr:hypothetical protein EYC84_007158 [Monilinia fructicola]KAG4028526.1 hypothetical protein MFRU_021g01140 [Monilinia fructicola]
MVTLSQVVNSNQTLQSLPPGLVSVFVGASHEFERATIRTFAKYQKAPRIYVIDSWVHQSKPISSFVKELETINPAGAYKTFNVRIGLLSEVDRVCDEIKKLEAHVDLLVMSCGFMRLPSRRDRGIYEEKHISDDQAGGGIPFEISLQFYNRQRFITKLLPLLSRSRCPRIISLLVPGNDNPLYFETLESSQGYLDSGSVNHATSLLFSEYAKTYPEVTFINAFPGILSSDTWDTMIVPAQGISWYPAQMLKWTLPPLFKNFICVPTEEVGERIVYLATSVRYPPGKERRDEGKVAGWAESPPGWRIAVARAMIMRDGRGNGVFRINEQGEPYEESEVLSRYLEQEEGKWLLEHTEEVLGRILNAERALDEDSESSESGE